MPTISVRVDDETKERMEGLETVNWSAVLRGRIEEVLTEHGPGSADRDLARAVLLTERVYRSVPPEDVGEWDSADQIRRDRERTFAQRRATDINESENSES